MGASATTRAHLSVAPITMGEFLRVSLAVHTVFFVLRFLYVWLDDLVREEGGTLLTRLIEEGTGACSSFLMSGFLLLLWRRLPLSREDVWRRAPAYLAVMTALGVVDTSLMWVSRTLLFPMFGLGPYDYGRMPLRYLMELPTQLIGASTIVATIALASALRERRAREQAQGALERDLMEAQLQNLRLQLQPHFLFNALNTISSRIADDPVGADDLLGRLAELLRGSLRTHATAEVPFREERELLDAYAALMRARFGERLDLTTHIAADVEDVMVPPLLLQPLVENAVRHGGLEQAGRVAISVDAHREGDRLHLRIEDDGPGAPDGRDVLAAGTGLGATARRLALLHGEASRLLAGNRPQGGFAVSITMPARTG